MRRFIILFATVAMAWLCGTAVLSHAGDIEPKPPFVTDSLDKCFGITGSFNKQVYTYSVVRSDLNLKVEGMEVPAEAGIESTFHFFQCSCGKMRVVGQFCCNEDEVTDVVDTLQQSPLLKVSSIVRMFSKDIPQLTLVRFQGEGKEIELAKVLRRGLDWTGYVAKKPHVERSTK